MEDILKSTLLEYEKSTFLVDLIKHTSGKNYVKIRQTIGSLDSAQDIKVNMNVLSDLILVLQNYRDFYSFTYDILNQEYLNDETQKSIVDKYYKGLTIKDIATQSGYPTVIIEQILYNKGIELVENKIPKTLRWYQTKKKKKR